MELNRYQKEMQHLLQLQDQRVNRQLYTLYVDIVKELKKSLLAEYQSYENLSRSKKMDLKRMSAMLEAIDSQSQKLKTGLNGIIPDHLEKVGKMAYNELFYEYEQTRSAIQFALLPEEELKTIIETPVAGLRLSQRINDGVVSDLRKNIKSELTRSFVHGLSYQRTAKRLSELGSSSYRRALNITRTEAGRVSAIARQRSQKEAVDLGIEFKKMWVATLDKRTRNTHQHLDGQQVGPEEYFEHNGLRTLQPHMFGIASEDCNCRCRTISRLKDDDTPLLRRDSETGEVVEYKNYKDWEKAIDRGRFTVGTDMDYLKSDKLVSPQKGKSVIIHGDKVAFRGRKVLNSKHDLYVSDSLGSARKSFSYYERQINDAMDRLIVPEGSPPPRFVLYDSVKDIGKKNNFGAYDPDNNTVFLNATKFNEKAIVKKLQAANRKWFNDGNAGKFFAVDNDARGPLVHELGHYKHYMHIDHHAKTNGITYAESKSRFNEKLLEFIDDKGYNIVVDISGYAQEHLQQFRGESKSTNEIISEANTLSLLVSDSKGKAIIQFLEKEDW
ncbi:phage minor head protein [Streptococcus suis]